MSPLIHEAAHVLMRFPRVSGDEPTMIEVAKTVFAFSPRERG